MWFWSCTCDSLFSLRGSPSIQQFCSLVIAKWDFVAKDRMTCSWFLCLNVSGIWSQCFLLFSSTSSSSYFIDCPKWFFLCSLMLLPQILVQLFLLLLLSLSWIHRSMIMWLLFPSILFFHRHLCFHSSLLLFFLLLQNHDTWSQRSRPLSFSCAINKSRSKRLVICFTNYRNSFSNKVMKFSRYYESSFWFAWKLAYAFTWKTTNKKENEEKSSVRNRQQDSNCKFDEGNFFLSLQHFHTTMSVNVRRHAVTLKETLEETLVVGIRALSCRRECLSGVSNVNVTSLSHTTNYLVNRLQDTSASLERDSRQV